MYPTLPLSIDCILLFLGNGGGHCPEPYILYGDYKKEVALLWLHVFCCLSDLGLVIWVVLGVAWPAYVLISADELHYQKVGQMDYKREVTREMAWDDPIRPVLKYFFFFKICHLIIHFQQGTTYLILTLWLFCTEKYYPLINIYRPSLRGRYILIKG